MSEQNLEQKTKNAAAQIMGSRNVEAKHRKENPYVLSEN